MRNQTAYHGGISKTFPITSSSRFSPCCYNSSAWPLQVGRRAFSLLWNLIPPLLSVAAFGLAYRLLPRTSVTIRDVWPAAILASVLWEFSKRGFVWYVTMGADYGRIYGSLSAVLILMLWAYVSSLIFSWGAELSAEIYKVRHNTGG